MGNIYYLLFMIFGIKKQSHDNVKKIKLKHCFVAVLVFSCRAMEFYLPIRQFFHNIVHPEYSAVTDVYVFMFLSDTIDFIIIVFGFWAFGVGPSYSKQ